MKTQQKLTRYDAAESLQTLRGFLGPSQLSAIRAACYGEEKQFFYELLDSLSCLVATMPETYGQDGIKDPTAYLHYFVGGNDWYITEKDSDPDSEGQIQAFGVASLNGGYPELGYISISGLIDNNVELDLYFTPSKLSAI